ncbi:brca1-a complex subunit abraxas [Lasius niger]|uniref:Brca1-a complex subunit abraxas n=2 Tax=Lasius TaxID=488720 RepID=A0A0J7KH43_LASNI|nr:brca1-a complex subunit abraxas [Lasius niger]
MGRGRGSGRGSHEFMPGMKKIRRIPGTSHMHSSRERSATPPEQDFSDAECPATPVSRSSPVLSISHRSYSQVTKKTNLDKCNTMAPFDI